MYHVLLVTHPFGIPLMIQMHIQWFKHQFRPPIFRPQPSVVSVRQLSKLDGMLDEIIDAVRPGGMRFLDCFRGGLDFHPRIHFISRIYMMAITFTVGPESENCWIGVVKSTIGFTANQTLFSEIKVTPFGQGGNTFWILKQLAAALDLSISRKTHIS